MIFCYITIMIFIVDMSIKTYVEKTKELHKEEEIFGGRIIIRKYHNRGVFLNFLENKPQIVLISSLVAIIGVSVIYFMEIKNSGSKLVKLGFAFLIGGALSNVFDRICRKYVVDYFSFRSKIKRFSKIIFNLSDIFIFVGGILVILGKILITKDK